MTCLGLLSEAVTWKLPHCGSCTLGDAILLCLLGVLAGAEFPPVRQGAPVLGRGQSGAVWLFLFPQLGGALSTSALRAERRKRRPKRRLSISISISIGIGIGIASASAAAPDPLRSQIDGEVLADLRPTDRRQREGRAPQGKSFQEAADGSS